MDEARSEGAPDAPARRRRGDGGRREKLLETATREFAAKGLAGARVDAIARAARSNKQLVYYYFGSKIGLYNEVVGRIGPGVHDELYPDVDDPSVTLVQRVRRRATHTWGPVATRWGRLRAEDPLKRWGQSVEERRGYKIAVIAVARRLVGILWAVWRDGAVYNRTKLGNASARGLSSHADELAGEAAQMRAEVSPTGNRRSSATRAAKGTKTCREVSMT